jgi:hypothetical protein
VCLLRLELFGDFFGDVGDVVEQMDFVFFDAGDVAAGVEFCVAVSLQCVQVGQCVREGGQQAGFAEDERLELVGELQ